MKFAFPALCGLCLAVSLSAFAADPDTRCYELRTYYAAPGKLDALQTRFREHTCALFEKHGFTNIGYWVPLDNPENKLVYIICSPDRGAHDKAWKAFGEDPEWKRVAAESEANGKLVLKVDSVYLKATDFSPAPAASGGAAPRCFELRTYTAAPGKMDALLTRFRDHTCALFARHGMTQVGYWTRVGGDSEQLVYILAHDGKEAGEASFKAFRADPAWVEAKKASEVNGTLTEKVESVFMAPLEFSPIR